MPEKRKKGKMICSDQLFDDIDYTKYLKPYASFEKEYEKQLQEINSNKKCFAVTFRNIEGLLYIAFATERSKAQMVAIRYFKSIRHPMFLDKYSQLTHARAYRKQAWDKYASSERIPVVELLKEGCKFPCCYCNGHAFTYEEYKSGKCVIVEGELHLNPFTEGIVVCKECNKKMGDFE